MTNQEAIAILETQVEISSIRHTPHMLALKLAIDALKSNWTVEKRREQAEWLKNNLWTDHMRQSNNDVIDVAFGLNEPTLEEKLKRRTDLDLSENEINKICEISRDYFKSHPDESEG